MEQIQTTQLNFLTILLFNDYTIKHELYFDSGLTEKFDFSTDIFQTTQEVYVKTILKTAGDQIPILREIELPYRFEQIDY
ncbi:hypothetical protein [Gottfriedia acidiceleris]|uniref:hypothetical protein n=1 Tax=Gottfriedia acidiceleris TaxID=371036 RepID=UPI002FFF3B8E